MENIESVAARQALRFGKWMITPKTIKGGVGRLLIGLMILNVPVLLIVFIEGGSSDTQAKKLPPIEQVQPSPVATPPLSPSPVQATTYDVTLQVNTIDGDRIPQPGKLEVKGMSYIVSIPFEGMDASDTMVRQIRVYEFNFAMKTYRQYCEDCVISFSRDQFPADPLTVDSVTSEGFSVTPKDMADELRTKDFYILRLTGNVKPDVWLKSTEQTQTIEEPIAPQMQEFREHALEPVAAPVPARLQVQTTPNPETADDYIRIAFVLAQDGRYDDAMINYQRASDRSDIGSCDRGHAEAGLTAATAAKHGETFLDVLTRESSGLPGECLL